MPHLSGQFLNLITVQITCNIMQIKKKIEQCLTTSWTLKGLKIFF